MTFPHQHYRAYNRCKASIGVRLSVSDNFISGTSTIVGREQ